MCPCGFFWGEGGFENLSKLGSTNSKTTGIGYHVTFIGFASNEEHHQLIPKIPILESRVRLTHNFSEKIPVVFFLRNELFQVGLLFYWKTELVKCFKGKLHFILWEILRWTSTTCSPAQIFFQKNCSYLVFALKYITVSCGSENRRGVKGKIRASPLYVNVYTFLTTKID